MSPPVHHIDALRDLLTREQERRAFASVLCVDVAWPLAEVPHTVAQATIDGDVFAALADAPRVDLALVATTSARAGGAEFEQILARLRDVHAERVLAAIVSPEEPDTTASADARSALDARLRALGFDALDASNGDARAPWLYRFDATCTKPTPTWLNAKHWANPENWDRFRW